MTFTWVGKRKSVVEAGAPINKTLRPDVRASKNWDTTENLFIEGDNLDALKLLQESYLGKIPIIYIDPPYNTGNDFVYKDNFKATVDQYDNETNLRDEDGNIQFKKNEKSSGRYHSDWLSMMYPRLKLARNLLTDDGVIFISIDDNEQANLKKICDEVFGEDNFVADFIIDKTAQGANQSATFKTQHEFLLSYSKTDPLLVNSDLVSEVDYKKFKYEDEKGHYAITNGFDSINSPLTSNKKRGYTVYYDDKTHEAIVKDEYDKDTAQFKNYDADLIERGFIPIRPGIRNNVQYPWNWMVSRFEEQYDKELVFMKNKKNVWGIYHKNRATGITKDTTIKKFDTRASGNQLVTDLMGEKVFDYPKSIEMIKWVVSKCLDKSALILDFFSGSGTTAHAAMQLNSEDGGSRKWIMVQLPEETDEKSEAFKAGYKTIPDISRERIRRAGNKIAAENPGAKVDYGFRSLTIADTNIKDVYKPAGETQQASLLDVVDNIKDDRSELDLLYGILTSSALELNHPIESKDIGGASVHLYDYFGEVSGLAACFASSVPEETIKEIAKLKPLTAVFRDSSFIDSQAKVNLAEHFRILSPDTKVKVI